MSSEVLKALYPLESATQVLGAIVLDVNIINNIELNVSVDDFYTNYHKVIFTAIKNMCKSGIKEVDDRVLNDYLENNDKVWHNIFIRGNPELNYIKELKNKCKKSNFKYYYNRLKKFAVLRDFYKNGFNISNLYDIEDNDKIKNGEFEKLSTEDIINYFSAKFVNLKDKHQIKSDIRDSFKAGEGLRELKEKLKESPSFGYPLHNDALTYISRGQRAGKFFLLSGQSGGGKTRTLVANAISTACPYKYCTKSKKWIANGTSEKALFISTELQKSEIQTMMIAFLSGVEEHKILDGTYTIEENNRIDKAIDLLEKADLYVEYISDFSMQDIEVILEKYIVNYKVSYLYFDYIHITPNLISQMSKKTNGANLREDQILFLMGAGLKALAQKYNVFIMSGTQVNRNYKTEGNLDASAIRGAMSLGDKIDLGYLITIPNPDELRAIGEITSSTYTINNNSGSFLQEKPNLCYTIYKNRGNKVKGVRLWVNTNLGNMSEELICVTDESCKPLRSPLEIKRIIVPNEENFIEVLNGLNS